jgi:glycine oxidase
VRSGPRVLIAGAGAFGSAIALALARAGADVTLADPAPIADNASGAAAGMLAPAFEAVLDPAAADLYPLLLAARDLWPGFAEGLTEAIDLRRDGALWLDRPRDKAQAERHRAAMAALGAPAEIWSAAEARRKVPGLADGVGPGLFTPQDWRLAPGPALAAIQRAAREAGSTVRAAAAAGFEPGRARLTDGEVLATDLLVAATGIQSAGLVGELSSLSPIKGQILHAPAAAVAPGAPVLRCAGGYLAGGADGVLVGATMEPGRSDRNIDAAIAQAQTALAASLSPTLAGAAFTPMAGVRASSPDGLPLVGFSASAGVLVAAGARRNGWLLAPLVAGVVAALVAGRDPGPFAAAMDARRFSSD